MFWGKAKETTVAKPTTPTPSSLSSPISAVPIDPSLVNPTDFFKYGFPGPTHDLQTRSEFLSVYNRQTRNPYYVVEHLTPESLACHNADRKNSFFKEDEQIPGIFRAKLKDYFRSGYDRGHQAPAANAKYSQNAMDETFYLTNMSPQVGDGFNRDYWAHLEYFTRTLTQYFRSVRIVTGPLFLPKQDPLDGKWKVTYEVIGNPPSVAVPTHFFKLVVAEEPKNRRDTGDVALAAFVLPNEPIPNSIKLTDFEVPLEALERATGLEFMRKLKPQKQKPLCKEVKCELTIREFNNNMKQLSLPQK